MVGIKGQSEQSLHAQIRQLDTAGVAPGTPELLASDAATPAPQNRHRAALFDLGVIFYRGFLPRNPGG